jgi:hypothetical protein
VDSVTTRWLTTCAEERRGSRGNAFVCSGRACVWAAAHKASDNGMASVGGDVAGDDRNDFAVGGRGSHTTNGTCRSCSSRSSHGWLPGPTGSYFRRERMVLGNSSKVIPVCHVIRILPTALDSPCPSPYYLFRYQYPRSLASHFFPAS